MKRGFASADLTQLIVGAALVGLSLAAPQSARAQYPIFLALGEGQAVAANFLTPFKRNEKLGGVDGFDQDKHAGEGDEGGEVLGGLLAA